MTGGITDVFQIIVLAARANAALGRGCANIVALLCTEKQIFKLHHSGIGKQQSGVIPGYQTTTRHNTVLLAGKVV